MIYDQAKYVSLCTHDFQKSLTNVIELPCKQKSNTIHKISQFGKICNKCTHIIKDSLKYHHTCIVCTDQLETYLKQRQLCQHEQREYFDIVIKCLDQNNKTHEVPFSTKICKRCSDKLRASFLNSKKCKVCEGKQQEVIRDMEKTFISSAFSHFKNVISLLSEAKASDEVFKNQIESACQAQPLIKRNPNSIIPDKLIEQYKQSDAEENHQSKRYMLYPKCRKHKDVKINVCNMCLVALLNLDMCPFGCVEQQKNQKTKVDKQIKTSETGFLFLYPQKVGESNYIEVFILKLIQERGRMDRWQCKIQKIHAKTSYQIKFQQKFPIFYAAVGVSNREFIVCGGAIGPSISKMKTTNQAFVVSLTPDLKQYSIIDIAPMNQARSGHSLVFHNQRKMVFAIGGLDADKNILNSTQVYIISQKKWRLLGDLNVQRTRTTGFVYKDNVYVLGGQSRNPKVYEVLLQKLNFQSQQWQSFAYDGFDFPFITDTTPSSTISSLQDKQSLYLFGGSNISDTCTFIQPMAINNEKKTFELNHKKVLASLKYPRVNSTIGFIKQDTMVCFGGLQEHQDLFSTIQGFNLKVNDKDFSIFSKLDDISIGSYRLILREDAKNTYKRLYNLLEEQGIIHEAKLSKLEDKNLAESHNSHLIERLWYTFGKSMLWVPDIKM